MKRNFKKTNEFQVSSSSISETETEEKEPVNTSSKVCNSCKLSLPAVLDRGICPNCGRIN